jgi:hypothetical protein
MIRNTARKARALAPAPASAFACALGLGLGLALAPAVVHAEAPSARLLRGVTAVDIVVEDPGRHAAQCGIGRGALESALRTSLGNDRVRQDDRAPAYVYLRTLMLSSANECLYTLTLELRAPVSVDETGVQGVASIWRSNLVEAISIGAAPARMLGAIERLADQLGNDWSSANR